LILLDWEKAFDKVLHSKMIETLQRLKVPAKIIKLIQCFYSNPDFKVSVNGIDSDWKKQKTGIRQGCPLSPYLFCLVMSAMFTDIKSELNTPKQRNHSMESPLPKFCLLMIPSFLEPTLTVSMFYFTLSKDIRPILG